MADPMHQFQIQKVVDLPAVEVFGQTIDMSITNSVLAMLIAVGLTLVFFALTTARAEIVPGRGQVMAEGLFNTIDNMVESIIGHDGRKFLPYVLTLFLFILACNLVGMFTYFTATSQLAVTITLALMTIGLVIIVGLVSHGLGFFKLFLPSGVPWYLVPLIIPIEIISFFVRPITLALRLFGNMVGGHIVLKVFAGFVISLAALGMGGVLGAIIPVTAIVALTTLEFLVAYLQAFVFAVLACVYLGDVVNIGHH